MEKRGTRFGCAPRHHLGFHTNDYTCAFPANKNHVYMILYVAHLWLSAHTLAFKDPKICVL